MFDSFSEFKFYQSFRIPVKSSDDLRFLVERDEDDSGSDDQVYIEDAKLVDISITGLGLSSKERISVGKSVTISLQFKKHHLDLVGKVVRAFSNSLTDEDIIYGVELDEEPKIKKFLESYILSFSTERLRESLIESAVKERYANPTEGFEMFSLLLSLFKDITYYGDREDFIDNMLQELVRLLNAQRASIFLINPESNELEAIAALGVNKDQLKFDYRLGIAGCVFTTGVALNIDTINENARFNDFFDRKLGFETKSIICHPIHNREDKIIGVIEILNKRNQDRFTVEDEKTMKVISLIFSSVFHNFNPISDSSIIRKFSTPFDRKYALIGKTTHISALRNTIIKVKDLEAPILIQGEKGVGKGLYARIIHSEGQRGLRAFESVNCNENDKEKLHREIWDPQVSKFIKCQGGILFFKEIDLLSYEDQERLFQTLKERRVEGSKVNFDVRVIASTSEDLGQKVDTGEFHEGLYHYFSKIFILVEPLRRRIEDLEYLVDYFLKSECQKQGLLLKKLSDGVMDKFKSYDWPGNIAELKKCIERAVLYNPKSHVISEIELDNPAAPVFDINAKKRVFGDIPHVTDHSIALKDRVAMVEREMILAEIKRNNGNKSKAAKCMGISREALRKKLIISEEILSTQNGEMKKQVSKITPLNNEFTDKKAA